MGDEGGSTATARPGMSTQGPEAAVNCGACQRDPPPFQRCIAPWLYDEYLGHLIQQWKFAGHQHLSPLLADLWLQEVPRLPAVDVIVPVPLHWRRQWRRGYNQSELLARQLRRRQPALRNSALSLTLIKRQRATAAQSGMNAAKRAANLHDAFTVRSPCDNLRVALVDDVLTTGSTARAIAAKLRQAGASHIEVWCVARTPLAGGV